MALQAFATDGDRNLAFLAVSVLGEVRAVTGPSRVEAIRRYLVARNLPLSTLRDIRTSRGINDYIKKWRCLSCSKAAQPG